ncbi:MAG: hypothetical protein R3E01_31460 [Pirellulaceae bacterium]|nr:hypothetical protein [Planctomycetales bacterium]
MHQTTIESLQVKLSTERKFPQRQEILKQIWHLEELLRAAEEGDEHAVLAESGASATAVATA